MRISVVSWNRRKVGGAEAYLDLVIPELFNAGHQLSFWHELDDPDSREQIALPQNTATWSVARFGPESALTALRNWSPDVIYAHGLLDPALEAATLEIAPAVFFAHAYYGTCISGSKTWSNATVRPCNRAFGPLCLVHYYPHRCGGINPVTMFSEYGRQAARLKLLRRYRFILTASEHMRSEFANNGLNARHVPLFISTSDVTPSFQSPSHSLKLLFSGRMDRLKGGLTLLDSLSGIKQALGRPINVTFAGDGPDRELWENRAATLHASDESLSFNFPGWVGGEVYEKQLAEADLLIVPSLWPEPFGLIGPQAGLRGVPAVAFNVGGITDWLKDGVNGYVAPGDPPTPEGLAAAVIKCFRDPSEYLRLRTGAATIAQRLNSKEHIAKLTPVLEEAIATGRQQTVA